AAAVGRADDEGGRGSGGDGGDRGRRGARADGGHLGGVVGAHHHELRGAAVVLPGHDDPPVRHGGGGDVGGGRHRGGRTRAACRLSRRSVVTARVARLRVHRRREGGLRGRVLVRVLHLDRPVEGSDVPNGAVLVDDERGGS